MCIIIIIIKKCVVYTSDYTEILGSNLNTFINRQTNRKLNIITIISKIESLKNEIVKKR